MDIKGNKSGGELLNLWETMAAKEDLEYLEDEVDEDPPPPPPLSRIISGSVANQYQLGTCFMHTIARVVVRHYYYQVKSDEEENEFCNTVITDIQKNTFIDRRCDGVNREKTILYFLIYHFLLIKYTCHSGAYTPEALSEVIYFINLIQRLSMTYDDMLVKIKIVLPNFNITSIDKEKLFNIINSKGNLEIMTFTGLTNINIQLAQGKYLAYLINGNISDYLMSFYYTDYNNYSYPGEIKPLLQQKYIVDNGGDLNHDLNHAIVIVKRIKDWYGCKNSGGDPRLVWIHKSKLAPERCFGVDEVRSLGGRVRKTRKSRKSRKSHKSHKSRKTRRLQKRGQKRK
jgi:hypothetical protein